MKCIEACPGDFISKEAFICILALCYVYAALVATCCCCYGSGYEWWCADDC